MGKCSTCRPTAAKPNKTDCTGKSSRLHLLLSPQASLHFHFDSHQFAVIARPSPALLPTTSPSRYCQDGSVGAHSRPSTSSLSGSASSPPQDGARHHASAPPPSQWPSSFSCAASCARSCPASSSLPLAVELDAPASPRQSPWPRPSLPHQHRCRGILVQVYRVPRSFNLVSRLSLWHYRLCPRCRLPFDRIWVGIYPSILS